MNKSLLMPLVLAAALSSACLLTTLSQGGSPSGTREPGSGGETAVPGGLFGRSPTPTPTLVPSKPVSIREGLASLNSYVLTIDMTSSGPSPADSSHIIYEMQ